MKTSDRSLKRVSAFLREVGLGTNKNKSIHYRTGSNRVEIQVEYRHSMGKWKVTSFFNCADLKTVLELNFPTEELVENPAKVASTMMGATEEEIAEQVMDKVHSL